MRWVSLLVVSVTVLLAGCAADTDLEALVDPEPVDVTGGRIVLPADAPGDLDLADEGASPAAEAATPGTERATAPAEVDESEAPASSAEGEVVANTGPEAGIGLATACADGDPLPGAGSARPDAKVHAQIELTRGVWDTAVLAATAPEHRASAGIAGVGLVACVHQGISGAEVVSCVAEGETWPVVYEVEETSWYVEVRSADTARVLLTQVVTARGCPQTAPAGIEPDARVPAPFAPDVLWYLIERLELPPG